MSPEAARWLAEQDPDDPAWQIVRRALEGDDDAAAEVVAAIRAGRERRRQSARARRSVLRSALVWLLQRRRTNQGPLGRLECLLGSHSDTRWAFVSAGWPSCPRCGRWWR